MSRGLASLLVAVLASACGGEPRPPVKAEDLPEGSRTKRKPTLPLQQANAAKTVAPVADEPSASVTAGDPDPGWTAGDHGELKVYAWQWRDGHDRPNPRGNVYAIGRTPYWFELGGLTEQDGEYRVGIKSRIRNAEGKVMYEAEAFDIVELPVDAAHPHAAHHTDSAQIPMVGEFRLELDLRDEPTGKVVTHSQPVVIE